LSAAGIAAFARDRIAGGDGSGQVMAVLKEAVPGRHDGKAASAIVRRLLEEG